MVITATPLEDIPRLVSEMREAFNTHRSFPLEYRKKQLMQLYRLIDDNRAALNEAIYKDLHKHPTEAAVTELEMIISEVTDQLEHIDTWAKPERPSVAAINMLDNCQVQPDPLGVVLIIGAWNYPYQLCLLPLAGAIAAGNAVILKPSEVSPNTAQIMAELVPRYLDPDMFRVVNGGVPETSKLLELKFDYICYTGNGHVGRIVMAAAAKHLCPVTLELGGKSPTYIHPDCDLATVARRVAWGRFMNNGQTCIAPDYVLMAKEQQEAFVGHLANSIKEFYGESPQQSEAWGRIVNANHFKRLSNLLEGHNGKVVSLGGTADEKDLYLPPTVVIEPSLDAKIMTDEIFGPILPIVSIGSVDEAIDFINKRDKPLALYAFAKDSSVIDKFARHTSSGGFIGNDVVMHSSVPQLPFGGVGASGMGAYHGKRSFDMFSHKKAVMKKPAGLEFLNDVRYPPYTEGKLKMIRTLIFTKPSNSKLPVGQIFKLLVAALIVLRIHQAVPGFWTGVLAFFGLEA